MLLAHDVETMDGKYPNIQPESFKRFLISRIKIITLQHDTQRSDGFIFGTESSLCINTTVRRRSAGACNRVIRQNRSAAASGKSPLGGDGAVERLKSA